MAADAGVRGSEHEVGREIPAATVRRKDGPAHATGVGGVSLFRVEAPDAVVAVGLLARGLPCGGGDEAFPGGLRWLDRFGSRQA